MPTVKDILNLIDAVAPFATQCDWDNSGLLVGDETKEVRRVGFALDLTSRTLKEAKKADVDLLVTHHLVIFRGKTRLLAGDPVFELVRGDIAVISCHTPFDCADGGVNDLLCALLELRNVCKVETPDTVAPMLRLGELERAMTPQDFAAFAAGKLGTTVRLASCGAPVKRVAVCGGAAMDLCDAARKHGADLFFTGDAKHHELLDAVESGISVLAGGHFETERPALTVLKTAVEKAFPALGCVMLHEENPVEFFRCNG